MPGGGDSARAGEMEIAIKIKKSRVMSSVFMVFAFILRLFYVKSIMALFIMADRWSAYDFL
jgi:hypothetical protein